MRSVRTSLGRLHNWSRSWFVCWAWCWATVGKLPLCWQMTGRCLLWAVMQTAPLVGTWCLSKFLAQKFFIFIFILFFCTIHLLQNFQNMFHLPLSLTISSPGNFSLNSSWKRHHDFLPTKKDIIIFFLPSALDKILLSCSSCKFYLHLLTFNTFIINQSRLIIWLFIIWPNKDIHRPQNVFRKGKFTFRLPLLLHISVYVLQIALLSLTNLESLHS